MDDDVLLKLSEHTQAMMAQAKAQEALTKAETDKANEYLRMRLSQERHTAIVSLLTEQAGAMLAALPEMIQTIAAIREWQDEASKRLESLERGIIIVLSGRGDNDLLNSLKHSERVSSLKRQLLQETENLNRLEEHKAQTGFDLGTENKITKTRERIKKINDELSNL